MGLFDTIFNPKPSGNFLGPINIPDFGISEAFGFDNTYNQPQVGAGYTGSGKGAEYGDPYTTPTGDLAINNTAPVVNTQTGGQTLGAQRTATGGGAGLTAPNQAVAPGQPSIIDLINQEYDALQPYFGQLEDQAQGVAGRARENITREEGGALDALVKNKAADQAGLDLKTQQAQQQEIDATTKTKQYLNQLLNKGHAYLASQGGYNSSTAPALAEAFGRTAQTNLGNIATQAQGILGQLGVEGMKLLNFYAEKESLLKNKALEIFGNIENELQENLAKIAASKAESRVAKASATMTAWQNYLNQKATLQVEAAQATSALDDFLNTKVQTLSNNYMPGEVGGINAQNTPGALAGIGGTTQQITNPSIIPHGTPLFLRNQQEEESQLRLPSSLPSTVNAGLGNIRLG